MRWRRTSADMEKKQIARRGSAAGVITSRMVSGIYPIRSTTNSGSLFVWSWSAKRSSLDEIRY